MSTNVAWGSCTSVNQETLEVLRVSEKEREGHYLGINILAQEGKMGKESKPGSL